MMARVLAAVMSCWLVGLITSVPLAFAQSTIPAPTPVRPLTNGIPNEPGSDALSRGDGAWIWFTHIPNATHYAICVMTTETPECINGTALFPVTARVNASVTTLTPGSPIAFIVTIPANREGQSVRWQAAACTGPNGPCGNFSPIQTVIVLLNQATGFSNDSQVIPPNRQVTFRWTNNPLDNAGAQLIVLPDGPPQNVNGLINRATMQATGPARSFPFNPSAAATTFALPPELGPAIKWTVASCRNYPNNGGRRCSNVLTSWKSLRVSNFFSTVIVPTMQHPRCVNCHAVAPDNFQNDPANNGNGGLPSNHPQVNANMDSSGGCANCHTNNLFPAQGTINPGWHAAPATMDFRNRSTAQLCAMAQQNAGNATGYQHLTQDKLILWAVNPNQQGNVQLPQGAARPVAPPGNIAAWQNEIFVWWFKTQKACD